MARPLRVEYEYAFYHVIARGHRKENIFQENNDRSVFLKKMTIAAERLHFKVHAFVLMSNHYHLLIETPDANIARVMHDINASYANWFKKKYGLAGSIFQGRYKAIVIEKDDYLLVVSAYIHLNPVRAGIVKNPFDFEWSSFRTYCGKSSSLPFLCTQEILKKFSEQQKYADFVQNLLNDKRGISKEEVYGRSSFLGSDRFIKKILSGFKDKNNCSNIPDSRALKRIKIEDILEVMENSFHVRETQIMSRKKGNIYRKIFIYLLRTHTDLKLREIGEIMRMKERTVSELSRYFSSELSRNLKMNKLVSGTEEKLKNKMLFE